jgi:hypothetical protein
MNITFVHAVAVQGDRSAASRRTPRQESAYGPPTAACLADRDRMSAQRSDTHWSWTESQAFEWWPVALVVLLAVLFVIARAFI